MQKVNFVFFFLAFMLLDYLYNTNSLVFINNWFIDYNETTKNVFFLCLRTTCIVSFVDRILCHTIRTYSLFLSFISFLSSLIFFTHLPMIKSSILKSLAVVIDLSKFTLLFH